MQRSPTEGSSPWRLWQPPKLFIDANLPDVEIRQTLLRYYTHRNPDGKGYVVSITLELRGGPANPVPWNGKRGEGVVLAILPKANGEYTDIRVIWVENAQSKLEDIEVQRVNFVPKAAR